MVGIPGFDYTHENVPGKQNRAVGDPWFWGSECLEKTVRLQKYLSMAGLASRREAEKMIREGRVKVNGETVTAMGIKVNTREDTVAVDNRRVRMKTAYRYILLHKPAGCLTTRRDPFGRPTVFDLLPVYSDQHLLYVGRLDFDTEGILFMTSDGELASRLMHPRYQVEKTYLALTQGIVPAKKLKSFREGMILGKEKIAPARAAIRRVNQEEKTTWLTLTVHEGKKRQIKRMCQQIGHPVLYLKRISFAGLGVGSLPPGSYRHLSQAEAQRLYDKVNLTAPFSQNSS